MGRKWERRVRGGERWHDSPLQRDKLGQRDERDFRRALGRLGSEWERGLRRRLRGVGVAPRTVRGASRPDHFGRLCFSASIVVSSIVLSLLFERWTRCAERSY